MWFAEAIIIHDEELAGRRFVCTLPQRQQGKEEKDTIMGSGEGEDMESGRKGQSMRSDVDQVGGRYWGGVTGGGDMLASRKDEEVRRTWVFVQLGTLAPVQTSPAWVIWPLTY